MALIHRALLLSAGAAGLLAAASCSAERKAEVVSRSDVTRSFADRGVGLQMHMKVCARAGNGCSDEVHMSLFMEYVIAMSEFTSHYDPVEDRAYSLTFCRRVDARPVVPAAAVASVRAMKQELGCPAHMQ